MKLLPLFESMAQDESKLKFQIQDELDTIINKYEALGMSCWIYLRNNGSIHVASIKVKDKTERRKGLGTALMNEITALCDKYKLLCTLTPENTETPMTVLMKFYKGFGFVPNSGKNKDFRFVSSMIRYPNNVFTKT